MLQLSNRAQSAITAMAKVLPKDSVRNYGNVIGIRNGKACITDGYGLLAYKIEGESPIEAVVTRDMFPSQVKFPQWEVLMPTTGQKVSVETCEEIIALCNAMGTKPVKGVFIALAGDKAWAFRAKAKVKSDATAFNPWVAKTFLKALPKNLAVTSGIIDDGKLLINFADGYSLLIVAVLLNPK